MDSIRVVVAEDNEITREMIVSFLSGDGEIEIVGQASDGESTVGIIKATHPDIVLLDLVMPKIDGIGVMETVGKMEDYGAKKPEYIMVSSAGSDEIICEAIKKGAAYFMLKPFDNDALIKRVKQTAAHRAGINAVYFERPAMTTAVTSADAHVPGLLRSLGVSIRMVGYKYIRDAIILAINDPDLLTSITKSIYPEVAKMHSASSANVERNIRYVIEVTWERRNEAKYADMFRAVFGDSDKKPANSQFILACVEWINYSAE